jgi:hypothetical protein
MLKRQQQGASVSDPALVEATIRESVKKSGVNPPGPRR